MKLTGVEKRPEERGDSAIEAERITVSAQSSEGGATGEDQRDRLDGEQSERRRWTRFLG